MQMNRKASNQELDDCELGVFMGSVQQIYTTRDENYILLKGVQVNNFS